MKILIDTNVILDVLTGREPHFKASADVLKLCGARLTGLITASQTTDIFYMLRREGKDVQSAKAILKKLTDNIKVINVTSDDVKNALSSGIADYEDALLACGAKRQKAEYIITRNEKDFQQSPVTAITPIKFLEEFYQF
jgi:predicted nucleic acid-binding protein